MKNEILDQFISELSRSSDHTQSSRGFYAEKFLIFAGDKPLSEWNKSLVNEFIKKLEQEEKPYAPGTIRFIYGVVKRVFDAAKATYEIQRTRLISEVNPDEPGAVAEILKAISLPPPTWDLGKRAAPRVEAEDMLKPTATFEEMRAMIAARDKLELPEIVYSGLSSIYGFRREELVRVRREHLDFKGKTIYVLTAKGGERRKQLLCDELIPYLKEYHFGDGFTPFQMSYLYWRICAKADIRPPDGSGWHSPRRYLDTVLRDLCGELHAKIFLRWKISSSPEMVERYYSRDPLSVDAEVFEKHPLVPLWQ